jgi:hypothetical protein
MNDIMDQLNFFYSYDLGLINYLKKKGFRYISKAKHIKTEKVFAVFIITDELNRHISLWNELHK